MPRSVRDRNQQPLIIPLSHSFFPSSPAELRDFSEVQGERSAVWQLLPLAFLSASIGCEGIGRKKIDQFSLCKPSQEPYTSLSPSALMHYRPATSDAGQWARLFSPSAEHSLLCSWKILNELRKAEGESGSYAMVTAADL